MKKNKLAILVGIITFVAACFLSQADEAKKEEERGGETGVSPSNENPLAFLPEIVATIGETKITREQLLEEAKPIIYIIKNRKENVPPEMWKRFAKELADRLVGRNILLQLAAADGINPSPELGEEGYNRLTKQIPTEQIQTVIKEQGLTIPEFKQRMAIETAIKNWIDKKIMPKFEITEEKTEKYYRENQDQFKKPETVKASHILITPKEIEPEKLKSLSEKEKNEEIEKAKKTAREHAEKILAELKQGGDFAKLAAAESACSISNKKGGDLGEFPRGRMPKEFEETAFSLKPGELSNVVETKFGYHIIKVAEHNKETYIPYGDVKEWMKNWLRDKEIDETLRKMIDSEKEKQKVKFFIDGV